MIDNSPMSIPVSATYRIIDGEPVRISAEYADITPDCFAQFLIRKFGIDAIFQGNYKNSQEDINIG